MANLRKVSAAAGSKTRIQNLTGEQTIKSSPGILHIIILSATVAGTLTVSDGATPLNVLQIGANESKEFAFNAQFDTDIRVTPSAATVDALVMFD